MPGRPSSSPWNDTLASLVEVREDMRQHTPPVGTQATAGLIYTDNNQRSPAVRSIRKTARAQRRLAEHHADGLSLHRLHVSSRRGILRPGSLTSRRAGNRRVSAPAHQALQRKRSIPSDSQLPVCSCHRARPRSPEPPPELQQRLATKLQLKTESREPMNPSATQQHHARRMMH